MCGNVPCKYWQGRHGAELEAIKRALRRHWIRGSSYTKVLKAKQHAWRHRRLVWLTCPPNASSLSVHEEGGESEHAGDAEPHTMQMSPLAEPQYTIPGMPDIPAAAPTSDHTPAPDPVPLPPLTLAPPLAVAPDPPLAPLTLASVAPDDCSLTDDLLMPDRQPYHGPDSPMSLGDVELIAEELAAERALEFQLATDTPPATDRPLASDRSCGAPQLATDTLNLRFVSDTLNLRLATDSLGSDSLESCMVRSDASRGAVHSMAGPPTPPMMPPMRPPASVPKHPAPPPKNGAQPAAPPTQTEIDAQPAAAASLQNRSRDFVIEAAAFLEKHARLKADAHAAGYILGQGATCGLVKIVDQTAHSQSTLRRLGHIDEQEQADNHGASSAAPHWPALNGGQEPYAFGRPPGMPPMQPRHGITTSISPDRIGHGGNTTDGNTQDGNTTTLAPQDGNPIAPPPTLPPGTNPANRQDHATSDSTVNHPVTIGFPCPLGPNGEPDGKTAAILMPLAPKWGGSKWEWEMETTPPKKREPRPKKWDPFPTKWDPPHKN